MLAEKKHGHTRAREFSVLGFDGWGFPGAPACLRTCVFLGRVLACVPACLRGSGEALRSLSHLDLDLCCMLPSLISSCTHLLLLVLTDSFCVHSGTRRNNLEGTRCPSWHISRQLKRDNRPCHRHSWVCRPWHRRHCFSQESVQTTILVFMHSNRNVSMSRGMMSSNVSIGLLFVEALCEAAHARPHTRGRRAPLSVVTGRLRGERGHVQRVVADNNF